MAPGRKPIDALIAEEQRKADEARAKIAALKLRQRAVSRKKDNHRKIIVGGAVMAHMRTNAAFRKAAMEALNVAVTEKRYRDAIPDLLDEKAFNEAMQAVAQQAKADLKQAETEKKAAQDKKAPPQ
jgi:exonuclease III